uniref:ribbon-helix-helix domain-containing protein n=1 Tax=Trichocoleus desertorum TaxID=1481672 RepID=UPI0025B50108|nr:type II toxin-antitoxin system ParD family antitoxin [Trichocoleus desertorum]
MVNISLPDQIQSFLDQQATAAGFDTASEYVYHLILQEQERLSQQERVESLLLEGIDSGEAIEATDDWWNQKRQQLVERFDQS